MSLPKFSNTFENSIYHWKGLTLGLMFLMNSSILSLTKTEKLEVQRELEKFGWKYTFKSNRHKTKLG